MKKIVMLICIMCLFTISCSANEITEKQAPVYARYIDNSYIGYGSNIENGGASVTADDITITVSGVNTDEKIKLVVMPITKETDGYSWFKEVLSKYENKTMPFYIYFINENGEKIDYNSGFNVSIIVPKGFANPNIYNINTNGNTDKVNSSATNNNISFSANGNAYYAVINNAQTQTETPQTGDINNVAEYAIIALFSMTMIVLCVKVKSANKKQSL